MHAHTSNHAPVRSNPHLNLHTDTRLGDSVTDRDRQRQRQKVSETETEIKWAIVTTPTP